MGCCRQFRWSRRHVLIAFTTLFLILAAGAAMGVHVLGKRRSQSTRELLAAAEGKLVGFSASTACHVELIFGLRAANAPTCEAVVGLANFRFIGCSDSTRFEAYKPFGSYLQFAEKDWRPRHNLRFDRSGIPQIREGDRFYANPVTVANYCLSLYSKYQQGDSRSLALFLNAAEALLRLQGADGSFRYPYAFSYYLIRGGYRPGWVSGMSQGLALSVFARAYHITGAHRFLTAGDRAFEFLLLPESQGGATTSLAALHIKGSQGIFFDEYPATPSSYTLNGFMFILLGLYDWAQTPAMDAGRARDCFHTGLQTLHTILPEYDVGGFTTYDLAHLTYPGRSPTMAGCYHIVHVELLHALSTITQDVTLQKYEKLWLSYLSR